jgi:hypothetical protein
MLLNLYQEDCNDFDCEDLVELKLLSSSSICLAVEDWLINFHLGAASFANAT